MELKPGYKRTEVGVIPKEWDATTIRGIASSARNAIVGGPFGSDLVSLDYVDRGVPVIRGQNMSGQWVSGNFVFVTPAKAKSLEANLARPGDIVFTQRGTLGQVSLVPEKPFEYYLVSQSQMKLSVNHGVANPLFFYYVFTSVRQQTYIRLGTIQTGVPHINLGILRDIPVQLPPLPEQRAIAGALSEVDALIRGLDQIIAKKRDLKQAVMQQLLTGKQRLPGFSGEWGVKKLGAILSYEQPTKYLVESSEYNDNNDIAVLTANKSFILGYSDENYGVFENVPVIIFDDFTTASKYVDFPFKVKSSALKILKLKDADYDLRFVFGKIQLIRFPLGDHKRYWISEYQHIEMEIPSIKEEQTAIATVLSDMDAEIVALEQRRDKTRALKQAMMQELLTGKTRLVSPRGSHA